MQQLRTAPALQNTYPGSPTSTHTVTFETSILGDSMPFSSLHEHKHMYTRHMVRTYILTKHIYTLNKIKQSKIIDSVFFPEFFEIFSNCTIQKVSKNKTWSKDSKFNCSPCSKWMYCSATFYPLPSPPPAKCKGTDKVRKGEQERRKQREVKQVSLWTFSRWFSGEKFRTSKAMFFFFKVSIKKA